MYFNNYIQITLYFPLVYIIIHLLTFTPRSNYFKKFKYLFGLLFGITFFGILIGSIYGIYQGKKFEYIQQDILKLLAFVFYLGLPFYIIAQKEKWVFSLNKFFNFFAFIYTVFVSLSLFIAGNVNEDNTSIFVGNLFGASTVNLTIISAWAFYSLAQYIVTKRKFFLIWSLLCYIDVIGSLSKWNIIAIIAYPILLTFLVNTSNHFSKFQKKIFIVLFCIPLGLFFLNINSILEPFVKSRGWVSVSDFLDDRVFGEQSIDYGAIGSFQVKDGYRFAMWEDLIHRTFENSLTGIGMGSRALESEGIYVEDHNIFITHFSRYGIVIFILWVWLVILVIKLLYKYLKINSSYKMILNIFIIMYINFFFQASVGNIWGQNLVVIFIGVSIGLMMFYSKNKILAK
jgi:hypothetical protein